MKAKTIAMIRKMLKQQADDAYKDFEEYVQKLNKKYETTNIYPLADIMEKDIYDYKERTYEDAYDALSDFESHEWR